MRHRGPLLALALLATPALAENAVSPVPAPVTAPAGNPDPWEGFNRQVFRFNDTLDRYALKPVAKGYRKVTPRPLRSGITNFFRNLRMPVVMLNDLLQGKVRAAGHDVSSFVVNSTVGLAGLIDVSGRAGIPRHDEDFGQTLGVWGVPGGPYVVLPFFGPSTVRDSGGLAVDMVSDPISWRFEEGVTVGLWAVKAVNTRANLLDVEEIVQGDRYLFLRDLYLQSRDFAVKDGRVESDPFLDDDGGDEPSGEGSGASDGEGGSGASGGSETAPGTPPEEEDGGTPDDGAAPVPDSPVPDTASLAGGDASGPESHD